VKGTLDLTRELQLDGLDRVTLYEKPAGERRRMAAD